MSARYFDLIREMKQNTYNHRLRLVESARERGIVTHTYQSDVETFHRLEEDEFFDLEDFSSRGDFLAKAHTYQLYFNTCSSQLSQRKSEPLANHRAPFSSLTTPTLLASASCTAAGVSSPLHPFRYTSRQEKKPSHPLCAF